ncbi:MAG: hypothetical protein PHP44_09815 [Kiritimatiellae bacterium]|nr:hypothetical protein [Kiritimatiellia bacterium]MDD4736386.1 hypothetical protein [Kiritimatiellia bacterium]
MKIGEVWTSRRELPAHEAMEVKKNALIAKMDNPGNANHLIGRLCGKNEDSGNRSRSSFVFLKQSGVACRIRGFALRTPKYVYSSAHFPQHSASAGLLSASSLRSARNAFPISRFFRFSGVLASFFGVFHEF